MKNDQDINLDTTFVSLPSNEYDVTYQYSILYASLGGVLLVISKVDLSEVAQFLGFGFLALSFISLLRPVRFWKTRRVRRNMRKVTRQQRRILKKIPENTRDRAGLVAEVETTAVSKASEGLMFQSPHITRTSILSKSHAEPTLVS